MHHISSSLEDRNHAYLILSKEITKNGTNFHSSECGVDTVTGTTDLITLNYFLRRKKYKISKRASKGNVKLVDELRGGGSNLVDRLKGI